MLDHQRDDRHGASCDQQFQQLRRDSFARQRHQVVGTRGAGGQPGLVHRITKARMEAEEAQDTQMILGDSLQRVADEAHAPGLQIVQAAKIVE